MAHKVLFAICIAGTLALLAGGVFFASYYFSNQSKLFIADIDYRYESGRGPARPLLHLSYEETMLLQKDFEWGGCTAQKHDKLNDTFRLHCWGLAKDIRGLRKTLDSRETAPPAPENPEQRNLARAAPPALYVTSVKQQQLSTQKKFITLLAAFSYHKLHLDIVTPQGKK